MERREKLAVLVAQVLHARAPAHDLGHERGTAAVEGTSEGSSDSTLKLRWRRMRKRMREEVRHLLAKPESCERVADALAVAKLRDVCDSAHKRCKESLGPIQLSFGIATR
eukprot:3680022-Rhodomonas_salina.1